MDMTIQSMPSLREIPRLLVEMIESNRRIPDPLLSGTAGRRKSGTAPCTRSMPEKSRELMPLLLTSLWLLPSVFPAAKEEMKHKFYFLGDYAGKDGAFPIMDESIYALVDDFFDRMPEEK